MSQYKFAGMVLFIVTVFLFMLTTEICADTPATRSLEVIIPEADTVYTALTRYRIAANTHPASKAYINGSKVRVYPSGAFVGMVNLNYGENRVTISAVSADGITTRRVFIIERAERMKTSTDDTLVIEAYHMLPVRDEWHNEGDIVNVRFKGSPGHDATFDIEGVVNDIPMRELPPSETNGVRGIYVGSYRVKADDYAHEVPVRFRLRKSFWSSIEAHSPGFISIMPGQFPMIGEVRGNRPFFNVGLGTDRLGGARLGFIEPGILLQIDGKAGNMFRVRLSNTMTAWMQSQFIDILSSGTPLPHALAGSIGTAGSPAGDVITLQLGQKLPYLTRQLTNPNRIEIDIYGVTSNTTWLTQHLSAEGIKNITWQQVSTDLYRLQIELNHRLHWGHRIEYTDVGNMHIIIRRPPVIDDNENILRGRTIAIDAGHGGNNRGALGATGAMEKDITLSISKMIEEMLYEQGAYTIMTRTDDSDVVMRDRVDTILTGNPDLVVSIHANSIGYGTDPERVRGTSTYYKHIGYKPFADIMYRHLLELGFAEFGVVGSFNFLLNDLIEIPNVLVETAFISNPEEEMILIDIEKQREIAAAVVNGIKSFFELLIK